MTEGIGSGGGHIDKAGGFINRKLYEKQYTTLHTQAFMGNRMAEFFDNNQTIYAADGDLNMSDMREYCRKSVSFGYIDPLDIFPLGTPTTIRSMAGDLKLLIDGEHYIMIGMRGEVYLRCKEQFLNQNNMVRKRFKLPAALEYNPVIRNDNDGSMRGLIAYAKSCVSIGDIRVYAKKLKKTVKIFPANDEEHVLFGKPGDYLCVRKDNPQDVYVVEKEQFTLFYRRAGRRMQNEV